MFKELAFVLTAAVVITSTRAAVGDEYIPPRGAQRATPPAIAPPPFYNWAGPYVGVAGGFAWGRSNQRDPGFFIPTGGGGLPPEIIGSGDGSFSLNGGLIGGGGGYNLQFSQWVLGLDAQAGWLWYVTGGFAYARMQNDYSIAAPAAGVTLTSSSVKHDLNGWTVGAGVETKLWGNWSTKLEYLFMDLGTTQDTLAFNNAGTPSAITYKTTYQDHIVRLGFNYRFGDPGPVVAWGH
jgi:outer membrane immunogenic protein